ncbi:KTSC domain-containing protein [Desulfobacter hydrogenophilus]
MKIRFNQGATYDYCRVPQNVFESFLSALSKGRFYDSHIKDKYRCH